MATDSPQVPYQSTKHVVWLGNVAEGVGAGAANLTVPGSQHYTRFLVQITGFTLGTNVAVQGSQDGTHFAPLSAANYLVPQPFAADANGVVFSFDTKAPLLGGIRFAVADNVAAGKIHVSMWGSPYTTSRM